MLWWKLMVDISRRLLACMTSTLSIIKFRDEEHLKRYIKEKWLFSDKEVEFIIDILKRLNLLKLEPIIRVRYAEKLFSPKIPRIISYRNVENVAKWIAVWRWLTLDLSIDDVIDLVVIALVSLGIILYLCGTLLGIGEFITFRESMYMCIAGVIIVGISFIFSYTADYIVKKIYNKNKK